MPFNIFVGLRVLDFSRVLAGPYATHLLADFGAEVIKVQAQNAVTGGEDNRQPYFAAWNRNKHSIVLDMHLPQARQVALELVRKCDVVVENFAPRVFDNWGFDYPTLRHENPGVILLRMSACGQSGPWRNHVAFGPTIQALSGLTCLTSYQAGPPIGPGFAYADVIAGLYGALAISSAIYSRAQTGQGQCIDLSMYEALVGLLGPSLIAFQAGIAEHLIRDESSEAIPAAPYGCFRCLGADEWCAIAVFDEVQWQALCGVLRIEDLGQHAKFASIVARRNNSDDLRSMLESKTSERNANDLALQLQKNGVPAAKVQNAKDLSCDPQLIERGFFVPLESSNGLTDRGPIRFGSDQPPQWRQAPLAGQDTDYVFRDLLRWPPEKIAAFQALGIIG